MKLDTRTITHFVGRHRPHTLRAAVAIILNHKIDRIEAILDRDGQPIKANVVQTAINQLSRGKVRTCRSGDYGVILTWSS